MPNPYKIVFFVLLHCFLLKGLESEVFAQNRNVDSLLTALKKDNSDTNKVKYLNALGWHMKYKNPDTSIILGNQALEIIKQSSISQKNNTALKPFWAATYSNLGAYSFIKGDYLTALDFYNQGLNIFSEIGNKHGISGNLINIGLIYSTQADYPKALEYYLKALRMEDGVSPQKLIDLLGNIGVVYKNQGNDSLALDYYFRALKMAEKIGKRELMIPQISHIAVVYQSQKKYSDALDYYVKALEMDENDENRIANDLTNIGTVYFDLGNSKLALDYFFRALKISEKLDDKYVMAVNLCNIGSAYTKQKKYNDAYNFLYRALELDNSLGTKDGIVIDYQMLSELYKKSTIPLQDSIGGKLLNMEEMRLKAMYYFEQSIAIRDMLFSEDNKKQLVQKQMQYDFDKKEAITKAVHDKEIAVADAEKKKQVIIIWSAIGGLLLVALFASIILRSLRITRKQKNTIELQKNEVSRQKEIADSQRILAEELREISEKQKHIVEEKQKEIVDSITYAKRIQTNLLTSDEYIKSNLRAEHFILFKPKDIVSGDFYWALSIARIPGWDLRTNKKKLPHKRMRKNIFYLATADCTGHGVPGAFMSMLNISFLNENIADRGIRLPHDVLNKQRKEIIKALNPVGSEVCKDGMDCILCAYDFDKMLLHFAAANNPLWLVRNNELIEYQGDKMPVGKYNDGEDPSFTLHTIELKKDDIIYTSTDGFADQFGVNGKKMMKKKFKEELLKIHQQPLKQQKEHLDSFFESWKGRTEQVDDVTVIGIKI